MNDDWRRSDRDQQHASTALIAAHEAADGLAELLRFNREGPASRLPFEWDPVEKLVEAAKMIASIERDYFSNEPDIQDPEGIEKLEQFIAACERFLDGWA